MRVLAAAEENRRLDLVALREEALDVLLLELVIVLIDARPELDLFDLDHLLVLLGLPSALLLLVLILAEVHDPADGRDRRRRDLHQIQALGPRERKRLRRRHDAQLRARVVNDSNLAHPNPFVGAHAIVSSWTA